MSKRNIVHIEIPAADSVKAGKFYHELFGWTIETDAVMNYTMWSPAEGPGGGFAPITENTKPGNVLIHVDSDDIEADLVRIKKLGGTVVKEKTEIPKIGWFALFKDPTGNTLALYTSMNRD
ncbi:MAG: VOC family protein [Anaerolineales bacterium]|jgi:hypothetical protein